MSIDFTHLHRESGLFVCVSVQLEWVQTRRVTPHLSIRPLHIPSSSSGPDLQGALTVANAGILSDEQRIEVDARSQDSDVISAKRSASFTPQVLLLVSVLLILLGELWAVVTERAQYLHRCRHWFQLLLASLTLATAVLQICFLSRAAPCVSVVREENSPRFTYISIFYRNFSLC